MSLSILEASPYGHLWFVFFLFHTRCLLMCDWFFFFPLYFQTLEWVKGKLRGWCLAVMCLCIIKLWRDELTIANFVVNLTHLRRSLNWRIVSIWLTCRDACVVFSWLLINLGEAGWLWEVPRLLVGLDCIRKVIEYEPGGKLESYIYFSMTFPIVLAWVLSWLPLDCDLEVWAS